jgi:sodium/potassium/calcium exchanger 6
MSVFWIWLFANIMIDLLKILGLLSGLPTTLLGLTVLAWGNSIGDFMANTSIAKKGFVEMALTGCFASPLFNILLGLGISTLKANLELGGEGIRFSYQDPHSKIPVVLVIGTIVVIGYSLIMTTIINKFHITKNQAKLLICIYGAIIAVASYRAAMVENA